MVATLLNKGFASTFGFGVVGQRITVSWTLFEGQDAVVTLNKGTTKMEDNCSPSLSHSVNFNLDSVHQAKNTE